MAIFDLDILRAECSCLEIDCYTVEVMKTNLNQDQMVAEYAAGSSITEIAAKHVVAPSVVTRVFKALGVAIRARGPAPKQLQEGKALCTVCEELKAVSEFYTDTKSATGCSSQCRACNKKVRLASYHANKAPLLKDIEMAQYAKVLMAQDGHCACCPATVDHPYNGGRPTLFMHRGQLFCAQCVITIHSVNGQVWHLRKMADYVRATEPANAQRIENLIPVVAALGVAQTAAAGI